VLSYAVLSLTLAVDVSLWNTSLNERMGFTGIIVSESRGEAGRSISRDK
jgi:hypothetical protein